MKISFISDTHSKHDQITKDLPGGDLIIHSGDFSNMGYISELKYFLEWFSSLEYTNKIFIAGNHDFCFQDDPKKCNTILQQFPNVIYLQDDFTYIGEHPNLIKIYGTPWQPTFNNWAFNIPRYSDELNQKWLNIPNDTDILITHTPPFQILDIVKHFQNVGCELLEKILININVKINCFGHIHSGYGYQEKNNKLFINASSLNEQYMYDKNKPINVIWNKNNNTFDFF
jgi:Icc-related predicted phosphoesterase